MRDKPVIAVDAMGGDFGPAVVVPGAGGGGGRPPPHIQPMWGPPQRGGGQNLVLTATRSRSAYEACTCECTCAFHLLFTS